MKINFEELSEAVGLCIREARGRADLTQAELADLSGLHRTYIVGVERGDRNLSLKALAKISEVVGMKPSEILKNAKH